jgi:histidine triad (HIT) family protein
MQDCIFCKIVQGKIHAKVITQNDRAMAFLDAFPLAAGHALVVPKTHYVKIQDMTGEDSAAVFALAQELAQRVESAAGTDASLMAVHNGRGAGQEVPHVHVHIIPRRAGDGAGPVHSMFRKPKLTPEEMDAVLSKMK